MALKRRTKVSTNFSMSSMTDIVFLLLIFFMITSTMIHPNAIKLVIPRKATTQVEVDKFLNVRVDASGNYYVNGRGMTSNDIESQLQAALATNDNIYVKLTAEKDATTGAVALVLDIAETNGVKVALDIK